MPSEVVPIAGVAGLGALAIGGLAFAFRRKRRDGEAGSVGEDTSVEPAVESAPTPAPLIQAPATSAGRSAVLPGAFDLSRFGLHVQEAYRGPTADNPSLSLRCRLSRARFYDQRARAGAETAGAPRAVAQPIAARNLAEDSGQVSIRLAPQRRATKFDYAYQK